MSFMRYEKRGLQSKIGIVAILLLISTSLVLCSIQPSGVTNVIPHSQEGRSIQSDSTSLSVPYVDEHYGYADGIIDPTEYSVNFTDPETGITAYLEHNSTTLFVGLSCETTGMIGFGWKNVTDDFASTGLNGSDLVYGYAPGSPHSSYSRATWLDAVTVNYSLYLRSGTLLEQGTFPVDEDTTPLGDLPVLSAYKEAILGMRIGEIKHLVIPAEDAFNNPGHYLYGEDLHYVIELTRINSNFYNPADSSQIVYSDRCGNDTLDSFQDSDQSRILCANASDDGTVTQVEYFIQMNSTDVNDISLLESTELEFPFVFVNSTEDFDSVPTVHTDWTNTLLLKFLPNTAPLITIDTPHEADMIEDTITINVNITDNTLVSSAVCTIDFSFFAPLYYNFQTGLWNTSISTTLVDLGNHILRVFATDASGMTSYVYLNITIVDYTAPEIIGPDDISIEGSPVGHQITWLPRDSHPDLYQILLNGSEIESGEWNGGDFTVFLYDYEPGVYNFTLVVGDDAGHQASDSVIVTITALTDTPPPDNPFPSTTDTTSDNTIPPPDVMYLSIAITGISIAIILYVGNLFRKVTTQD